MTGKQRIVVLRLGHRPQRDQRITTHVGLVARAFGADEVIITPPDEAVRQSIAKVTAKFGGTSVFAASCVDSWKAVLRTWHGTVVHLTMYGIHIDAALRKIPKAHDLIVVVGAEKVPRELYDIADFNVAIGNQPHSEVAALAVFLDRYTAGAGLRKGFSDAEYRILPCARGKRVVRCRN